MQSGEPDSLRERKKRRTRQAIADAALRLFQKHGFDGVTVAEVAAAADVSEKTVFNHFSCKEELLFDSDASIEAELVALVSERGAGVSVIEALRGFGRADAELGEVRDNQRRGQCGHSTPVDIKRFQAIIAESPALVAHWSGLFTRYEKKLREALLVEIATDDARGRTEAYVLAAGAVAALRLQFESDPRPPRTGRSQPLSLGLNALERGFKDWRPRRR